jgi:hypothetical protein
MQLDLNLYNKKMGTFITQKYVQSEVEKQDYFLSNDDCNFGIDLCWLASFFMIKC